MAEVVFLEGTLHRLGEKWALVFTQCGILAVFLVGIFDTLAGTNSASPPFT